MNGQLPQGIKALETRPLRLPRAGRIRLGEKRVNERGKEYPRELDYFNVEDAPLVAEIYGDKPRELDIILPINDRFAIADICYMAYGQSGWKCRGNGDIAWNREADDEIECLGEECPMVQENKCKRQMRLTFVAFRVPGLCVHDLVTSGWRSIENTLAFLDSLESLFGRIDGIPLKLYREPYQTSYTDDDGKTHAQTHHCIRLDVAASLLDVKRLQLGGEQPLELPPAPVECADDMYPKSLQKVDEPTAMEEGMTVEVPGLEPEAKNDLQKQIALFLMEMPKELRKDIITGFEITGRTEEQQLELLERFNVQPKQLQTYLSALVDNNLKQSSEKPKKPRKTRQPKVDQQQDPPEKKPALQAHKAWF